MLITWLTSELDKSEGTRQESKLNENNLTAKLVLIAERKHIIKYFWCFSRHIKLTILSGYDHFVAVYHIEVPT